MSSPSPTRETSSSGLAVGVDVGGTKIAAGLVASDGTLISRARRDSPSDDADAIVAEIADIARELCGHQSLTGVPLGAGLPLGAQLPLGVGAAGMVDRDGTVVYAPNLAWSQRPVRRELAEQLGVPVTVANDACVAAWGEFRAGAARDVDGSIVMLTLGTGVGGGLVVNNALAMGTHGMGAEFGHMIVAEGGRQCPCGNRGCLEAYASGTAIGRMAQERVDAGEAPTGSVLYTLDEITGKTVTLAAHAGDEAANEVLATCGFWLGVGIASLVNALDPAVVVIGGGAMQAGERLLAPAREASHPRVLGELNRDPVPIIRAILGDDAGVIGAGLLALSDVPTQGGSSTDS